MLRKEIVDFLGIELPDDWDELTDAETEDMSRIIDRLIPIDPLTKEEALAVANHMGRTDLDGLGQSLGGSIATASEWPYQMTELFYVDKFSDPLCSFKGESFFVGFGEEPYQGITYHFQSEANQGLTLNSKNYTTQLLLLREGVTRVDFQAIMSILFWDDPEDLSPELLVILKKVAQKFFSDNESVKSEMTKNSHQSEFLESILDIKI